MIQNLPKKLGVRPLTINTECTNRMRGMNRFIWRSILALAIVLELHSNLDGQSIKPNIVFILVDNLGWGELGVYGGGILRGAPTPRIDKFAGEGLRLLNYNVDTECVPTRASLMTGRHAIRTGTLKSPVQGQPNGLVRWEVTAVVPSAETNS